MAYERKNMEPYGCAADTGDERFPSGGLRREDRGGRGRTHPGVFVDGEPVGKVRPLRSGPTPGRGRGICGGKQRSGFLQIPQ